MSCIYGPHQFGTEDQGWVAHFLIKALNGDRLTIYGDGRQVRDVLFVEDLVDAFVLAQQKIEKIKGEVFNIGGGPEKTLSLLELLDLIQSIHKTKPEATFSEWRPADQQYYVSDTRKFMGATGWFPKVGVREGVTRLYEWLRDSRAVFTSSRLSNRPPVMPRSKARGALISTSARFPVVATMPKPLKGGKSRRMASHEMISLPE
jgi:CDP-paratose 2-epimerase